MHFCALLSGGKDSLYSLHKAVAQGHTCVALAHIQPPCAAAEADSWMYQSVGSTALPYIAQALKLPLYTRRTTAVAKRKGLAYVPADGDEVEDLVELLRDVKKHHPETQAVCAGALWSDYQRLRVENASSRAGLLSLAPLWRRDQRELLDEMIEHGVEAIVIKVAGIGLKTSHLGRTLKELRPTLHELHRKYGSHICGEGGEFETLVVSMPLFKRKRLVLDNVNTIIHEHSKVATVAYLDVKVCHLHDIDVPLSNPSRSQLVPPVPRLLCPVEKDEFLPTVSPSPKVSTIYARAVKSSSPSEPHTICVPVNDYMQVVCLSTQSGYAGVSEACTGMKAQLEAKGFSLADILYVYLNLSSVEGSAYAEANSAYNTVFGVAECVPPPSRACIAMPNGRYASSIEVFARKGRRDNKSNGNYGNVDARTLHVQSLSEWAPPCIGPYAQVNEDNGITFVSGAIPMHAPTAALIDGTGIRAQTRGCLFNLKRTLEATRSSFNSLTFFVAYAVAPAPKFFAAIHEEFRAFEDVDEKQILAVVPCTGLPKDALVEIRAVGSYRDPSGSNFAYSNGIDGEFGAFFTQLTDDDTVKVYAVRHGALMFAKVYIASEKMCVEEVAACFLEKLETLDGDDDIGGKLLSTQVYVAAEELERMRAASADRPKLNFISCADGIPGDNARCVAILTLRCGAVEG